MNNKKRLGFAGLTIGIVSVLLAPVVAIPGFAIAAWTTAAVSFPTAAGLFASSKKVLILNKRS